MGGKCEYLFKLDEFYGVPSYLNECTDTTAYGSYHQCTEYAARYLHYRFGTDYTDVKNTDGGCAARNTQGFKGYDFHPNYAGNPPKPSVDKKENGVEKNIPLTPIVGSNTPQAGDIVIDTNYGHTAVVKSVDGATVTLIEQNWLSSGTYTIGRKINTPKAGVYFYRFPSVYATGSTTPAASIQAASDSLTTNGQTVSLLDGVIKEDVTFTNNVFLKLIGGYESTFTSNPGWTIINGTLIFKGKAVTVDRICIQ